MRIAFHTGRLGDAQIPWRRDGLLGSFQATDAVIPQTTRTDQSDHTARTRIKLDFIHRRYVGSSRFLLPHERHDYLYQQRIYNY